ncbi:Bifunctional purine biosynthesis protein PurH [Alphaproteobacteria bacterium SO-S41]|nr:Bifunctional purine biosynthesis protein PurH [Alphaproteobacteria bacterium SO-S41]
MTDQTRRPIRRALLSVYDKTGLAELGRALAERGVTLVSTGGSAKTLREAGLTVLDVADVTGFPEMMDGRVKTLHPKVHGGLLAIRENAEHAKAMREHGIEGIDLLVSNLYPFEATVAATDDFDAIVEQIDIGGPAMIRAASKNHAYVAVVTDPADYARVLEQHDAGGVTGALRRELSAKAFGRTAAYDAAISSWFEKWRADASETETTPARITLSGELRQALRYGENPHQSAAFYTTGDQRFGVATARQVQGKELSYNNLNDTDAAFELVAEFDPATPAVAIIKHANPCGVAIGATFKAAYEQAYLCDTVSAFGGIVALNGTLDEATAEEIAKIFTEVIVAPDATEAAQAVIAKKKNLRLLLTGGVPDAAARGMNFKTVAGGFLVQERDAKRVTAADLKIVTKRQPTPAELTDMLFAFTVAKHVKSNAIVFAKEGTTVGIGAGQMNRRESSRIAAWKAEDARAVAGWPQTKAIGSAAASDAFFPFADGLLECVKAGATAVIQPGGSIRDDEVIAAADEAGIAMAFTGVRHFRH